jgi:hypothetical protein
MTEKNLLNAMGYALALAYVVSFPVQGLMAFIDTALPNGSNGLVVAFSLFALMPALLALTELIRMVHVYGLSQLLSIERSRSALAPLISRLSYDPFGLWTSRREPAPAVRCSPQAGPLSISVVALSAFLGAAAIHAVVTASLGLRPPDVAWHSVDRSARLALAGYIVVFSPLAESLLNAGIVVLLRRFTTLASRGAVLASAALWALLHAIINSPVEAPGTFWLFLVLSALYMHLNRQQGWARSAMQTAAVHAANNALSSAGLLASVLASVVP